MGNTKNFLMRYTLVSTVLACLAIMSIQATNQSTKLSEIQRRISMTNFYYEQRRLGFKLPKAICKPAHSAGSFIIVQAMNCAMQAAMPGSGLAAKAVKVGKAAAKKVGVMDKIMALKKKAADFIMKKFLGVIGCKFRRRMSFFKKIGKAFKKATKKVAKVAKKAGKGVAKVAKKGVKGVAKAGKAVGKGVAKAAKTVEKGVAKAAKTVAKGTKFIAKHVAKAAKMTAKFVKKYAGIIGKVLCKVIAKVCKPACMAVVTAFKAAGAMINSSFHIPVGCLADALGAGCNKLCEVVCKHRRLRIRRLTKWEKSRHESKEELEGWKTKLSDDEKKPYQKKNEFENEKYMHSRRMRDEHLDKKEQIPSEKQRFDN